MFDRPDSSPLAPRWRLDVEEVCARPELIQPAFQPIVDLRRGRIAGYEALARFSTGRVASPADWFSAATLWGQAARLEASVLRVVFSHRPALPPNCFLSINLSPEAVSSPEVAGVLEAEACARGLHGIVLEITEQTPVEDYERLGAALAPLRDAGAFLAVDDVGAGYANLRHVMALRPGFLKLDRDVVSGVHSHSPKAAAVTAFGAFASELDAWIVAEGIEAEEEIDALIGMGVPLGQGHVFARPGQPWAALDPALGEHIRGLAARRDRPEAPVAALASPTATVSAKKGIDGLDGLGASPRSPAVTLDEHERPVALLVREPEGHWCERPVLCADRGRGRRGGPAGDGAFARAALPAGGLLRRAGAPTRGRAGRAPRGGLGAAELRGPRYLRRVRATALKARRYGTEVGM